MTPIRDSLRTAIEKSGLSANEIARQVKLPQSTITRFLQGTDMRVSAADKLAAYFGLVLVPETKIASKPTRTRRDPH